MTAGTIRRLKTSNTPAVVTELVTTMANDRKKAKSQIQTAARLRPPGEVSAGQRKQRPAREPVQNADHRVQRGEVRNVGGFDRQNAADQDLLDMLRALRRAIDHQYRRRGGRDVDDADERFLAHIASETAGQREKRCAQLR